MSLFTIRCAAFSTTISTCVYLYISCYSLAIVLMQPEAYLLNNATKHSIQQTRKLNRWAHVKAIQKLLLDDFFVCRYSCVYSCVSFYTFVVVYLFLLFLLVAYAWEITTKRLLYPLGLPANYRIHDK